MIGKKHSVIYFSRDHIEGISVSAGSSPKILKQMSYEWNTKTLSSTIHKIIGSLTTNKLFVVLEKNLTYVVQIPVPKNITKREERNAIYQIIQKMVPEDFEDSEWDYKKIISAAGEESIFAAVPVKSIVQELADSLWQADCKILSVEPEQSAILKNSDPRIGITIQEHSSSSDESSLNLKSFLSSSSVLKNDILNNISSEQNVDNVTAKSSINFWYLYAVLAGIMVAAIYIFIVMNGEPFATDSVCSILKFPDYCANFKQ